MERLYQIFMPQNLYRNARVLAAAAVFLFSLAAFPVNRTSQVAYASCTPCAGCGCGDCDAGEVCTPAGCFESPSCEQTIDSFSELIGSVFDILFPIAIIIGFFLIARAGYMLMTSQGDPARVKEGKEEFSSAIMGLIFVALAVTILRLVITLLVENPGF